MLVHHLLLFFKSTLTVTKVKDLVNYPTQKYQAIYDTLSNDAPKYTNIDLLPDANFVPNANTNIVAKADDTNNMKNELKSFLKKQLTSNTSDFNATEFNATEFNASKFNASKFNATEFNATEFNASKFNATEFNATEFNTFM